MIGPYGISGKSIILIGGGLFLLIKTFQEIKEKIYNGESEIEHIKSGKNTFNGIILQIIIIDFVFSFDSILAAVGISGVVLIMISAVLISMLLMILFSGLVSNFINKNKGIKTIALSFLLVIGGIILAEGIFDCYNFSVPEKEHLELNKNYAYIALAFALLVESFNLMEGKVKQKKDLEI
jgi:predicted tellurium resistance membrane protein TerC